VVVVLSVAAGPLPARAALLVTALADRAPAASAPCPARPECLGAGAHGVPTAYQARGDVAEGEDEDEVGPRRPAAARLLPALQAFALVLAIPGRDILGPPGPGVKQAAVPPAPPVGPPETPPVTPPFQVQPPPWTPPELGPTPPLTPQLVPEPATLVLGLTGSGLFGLAALAWRRRAGARSAVC
jgi:hypothetical protein